jgi:SAM-dependent methyltransferase
MSLILCPVCKEGIDLLSSKFAKCSRGHAFEVRNGVIDLMPKISDASLKEEEEHWNKVTKEEDNVIRKNSFMNGKMVEDCRRIYKQVITNEWSDYQTKHPCIGEIGCGSGSAISYLRDIGFASVNYVGADISLDRLVLGASSHFPRNWVAQFIRTSVAHPTFKENSLDIAFSAAALHHLNVNDSIKWLSASIKKGGLLILNEPSIGNPFAKIGRKMTHGFHTKGEKPLMPGEIKAISGRTGLTLTYEKGLHFLTGSLQYLLGNLNLPKKVVLCSCYLSRGIDRMVASPYLNYSFIQVYRKM